MPYTLTHPGFILPLKRVRPSLFSTTGLFFGSIAPDFDIILRFSNQRIHIFQYNLQEILLLILPISVAAGFYFQLLIKGILIEYAPQSLQVYLSAYKKSGIYDWGLLNWVRLILSSLLAIFMHLGLDLISHYDAYFFKINATTYFQSITAGEIAYYVSMYLPPLLFSFAGTYLTLQALRDASFPIPSISEYLIQKKTRIYLLTYILLTLFFSAIKIIISGIEHNFVIDSFVISITNGFLISFFVTPTIFALTNRVNFIRG